MCRFLSFDGLAAFVFSELEVSLGDALSDAPAAAESRLVVLPPPFET
jgi:hypothetical protein